MSINRIPPILTNAPLLGSIEDDWGITTNLQPFDPTADCTDFIALPGLSTLPQDFKFRPFSTSLPINTAPITINQPRVLRPESQEDWDAKKDVIRCLYLDENLPLKEIIDVMSKEHSFAAT
ncbi:hypothetical protein LZ30DRAFT_601143 [Colletotrichum cereale]|nr:hypothetical protein LZ30DRAFT_601143 [Colletotrichum cereale]